MLLKCYYSADEGKLCLSGQLRLHWEGGLWAELQNLCWGLMGAEGEWYIPSWDKNKKMGL